MAADGTTPPKYDPMKVGHALLSEVIEQHPARLTVDELVLRVVAAPEDGREVETATDAVRDLRRACLVRYRNDDELVEPTQAALLAHALFAA